MPSYIVSFSGAVDIQADSEAEARRKFLDMSNEEIGQAVDEYDEIALQENFEDKFKHTKDAVERHSTPEQE